MKRGNQKVVMLLLFIAIFLVTSLSYPNIANSRKKTPSIASQAAKAEIYDLIMNYEWAVDNSMEPWASELFGSIFAEDAQYSIPAFGIVIQGREAIVEMFNNWIKGAQDNAFSHISGLVIEVNGRTATARDSFYHMGYSTYTGDPACSTHPDHPLYDPDCAHYFEDVEITAGWHFYELEKIKGEWKITWMEGRPQHNSAIIRE